MDSRPPVLAIGIDAAEAEVIDRLIDRGRLPTIARLRNAGWHGTLTHRHGGLQSSVWRSFVTGQLVTGHGCYFPKAWRAERMRVEFIDDEWPPARPVWTEPGVRPHRMALVDVPYMSPPTGGFDGLFLSGWQCHDVMPLRSNREGLPDELAQRFGKAELGPEQYGPQTAESLERTHRETLAAARQIGEVCAWLIEREPFDLFTVVLGSAHRAGHYLWDLSQIDAHSLSDERRTRLEAALDEVYEACDASVGRILAAAPADATVLLFALHGMGPNLAWYEQLPALMELATGSEAPGAPHGLWGAAGSLLASPPVKAAAARIPGWLQHRLTPLWTRRMRDWSATPHFTVPSDLNGYIRLNLVGREPQGIVPPDEARAVAQTIADGLRDLVDIGTGRPICERVELIDDLPGADRPMRAALPDIVAQWSDLPLSQSSGVRNSRGDERRWPRASRYRSGRSGNHRRDGWMIASAPHLASGRPLGDVHALDLAPTLCRWLGCPPPSMLDGEPIEALVAGR